MKVGGALSHVSQMGKSRRGAALISITARHSIGQIEVHEACNYTDFLLPSFVRISVAALFVRISVAASFGRSSVATTALSGESKTYPLPPSTISRPALP